MTDFEKARLYFVLVFFGLLLPQIILNYFIVSNPSLALHFFNALHIQTYGLNPLRTIGRALLLFQALNCLVLAEKTRVHGFWKWTLVLGVFSLGFIQWIALAVLLLQRPKLENPVSEPVQAQALEPVVPVLEANPGTNASTRVVPLEKPPAIKKKKITKTPKTKTAKKSKPGQTLPRKVKNGVKTASGKKTVIKKKVSKK